MREAILAAARRLVAEGGVDALQMRAVAGAIGYSVAALYEYFPAKDDILICLYFEGAGGLAGRMRLALGAIPERASAHERIVALGRAYRAYAHEQRELFLLVFTRNVPHQGSPHGGEHAEDGDDGFDLLVEVARDGIERGEFASVPPAVLAMAAWTLVHGFVMLELGGHFAATMPAGCAPGGPKDGAAAPSPDDLFAATVGLGMQGLLRRQ